jgi:hypothetical protein
MTPPASHHVNTALNCVRATVLVVSAGTNVTLRHFLDYKPHILTTSPSNKNKPHRTIYSSVNLQCPTNQGQCSFLWSDIGIFFCATCIITTGPQYPDNEPEHVSPLERTSTINSAVHQAFLPVSMKLKRSGQIYLTTHLLQKAYNSHKKDRTPTK